MIRSNATLTVGGKTYELVSVDIKIDEYTGKVGFVTLPSNKVPFTIVLELPPETFTEMVDFEEWQDGSVVDLVKKE